MAINVDLWHTVHRGGKITNSPHSGQEEVIKSNARFKVIVCGRRWGKTLLAIVSLLVEALNNPGGLYWYVAPTYRQAKNIAWRLLMEKIRLFPKWWRDKCKIEKNSLIIELPNHAIIELKGAQDPDCFDDETEILTNEGWKLFKDLNKNELVLGLNDDGKSDWVKPIKYIDQPYSDVMYLVKSSKIDALVTPNHKFYIKSRKGKLKFKKIGQIADGDSIPRDIKFYGNCEISDDENALMGFYLAEGSAYGCVNGVPKNISQIGHRITFAQTRGKKGGDKGDVRKEFEGVLDRLGLHFTPYEDAIVLNNKKLHSFFLPLGSKYTKYIPQEYKDQSPEKLKILLKWLILGDGTVRGNEEVYYTTSKRLADDVQEIAIKIGYGAKITKKVQKQSSIKGRKISSMGFIYQVSILKSKNFHIGKGVEIKEVDYDGRVYCVSVPNQVIMVRRNGIPFWSGNSLVGSGLDGVVLDEYAMDAYGVAPVWKEAIRPALSDKMGWAIFISSPRGYNHFFELYDFAQSHEAEGWQSWKMPTSTNPYISRKELETAKREIGDDLFSQEYEAEFKKRSGLVYKEFSREAHVIPSIEPKDIPSQWQLEIGLDFGASHPTAALFVMFDHVTDTAYVVDEHYESEWTTDRHIASIMALEDKWLQPLRKKRIKRIGDSQAKQSLLDYAAQGYYITPTLKGRDSVDEGISDVRKRLENDKITGKPKLFICKNCVNTIREFENYSWYGYDDAAIEVDTMMRLSNKRKDEPRKIFDDAMDALRYVIQYHSPVGDQFITKHSRRVRNPITGT